MIPQHGHHRLLLQHLMRGHRRLQSQRNLLGDFKAVAFEGHDLARMVGENANSAQAEVDQDLRPDAAFSLHEPLAAEVLVNFRATVELNSR